MIIKTTIPIENKAAKARNKSFTPYPPINNTVLYHYNIEHKSSRDKRFHGLSLTVILKPKYSGIKLVSNKLQLVENNFHLKLNIQ